MSILQEKFKAIADKIRECLGTTELIKPNDFVNKVTEVYEKGKSDGGDTESAYTQGKTDERKAFWEKFQDGGKREDYSYAFYGGDWTDEIYNPIYPFVLSKSGGRTAQFMFARTNITDTKQSIDGRSSNLYGLFNITGRSAIQTVHELIVDENTTYGGTDGYGNMCYNNRTLEELNIVGTIGQPYFNVKWCEKLTHNSLTRIINCLSDTTTDLTVTLSLRAVNKAFKTSEGAADGSTSAEWLELIETKSNWTISLV